jgi:hypothetical protein
MYQKFAECDKFRFITCNRTLSSSPGWTTPHHEEGKPFFFISAHDSRVGRGNVVAIGTRYGLDGPGIEFRLYLYLFIFSAHVQTGPDAYPASHTMGAGSYPWVKRPVFGVDHPPPSSAEFKERVGLYIYSLFGPSWPVLGRPLPVHSKKDVLTHHPFCFARFPLLVKDIPRTATCCRPKIF